MEVADLDVVALEVQEEGGKLRPLHAGQAEVRADHQMTLLMTRQIVLVEAPVAAGAEAAGVGEVVVDHLAPDLQLQLDSLLIMISSAC